MNRLHHRIAGVWAVLLAFAVAAGMLAGCSGSGGIAKNVTAAEVGAQIQQTASMDGLEQGDGKKLQKLYHIDPEDIEGFVLYTAVSNVKADELVVLKLKDENDAPDVKAHIAQRIDAQTVKFQDYRPEEYYLVEKHALETKGPFVFFAVSKEAERMERAFEEALR